MARRAPARRHSDAEPVAATPALAPSAQADPDSPPFADYPCGNVIAQHSGYYNPLQFPVDWPQDRPPPLPPVGAPPLIVMPPGCLLPSALSLRPTLPPLSLSPLVASADWSVAKVLWYEQLLRLLSDDDVRDHAAAIAASYRAQRDRAAAALPPYARPRLADKPTEALVAELRARGAGPGRSETARRRVLTEAALALEAQAFGALVDLERAVRVGNAASASDWVTIAPREFVFILNGERLRVTIPVWTTSFKASGGARSPRPRQPPLRALEEASPSHPTHIPTACSSTGHGLTWNVNCCADALHVNSLADQLNLLPGARVNAVALHFHHSQMGGTGSSLVRGPARVAGGVVPDDVRVREVLGARASCMHRGAHPMAPGLRGATRAGAARSSEHQLQADGARTYREGGIEGTIILNGPLGVTYEPGSGGRRVDAAVAHGHRLPPRVCEHLEPQHMHRTRNRTLLEGESGASLVSISAPQTSRAASLQRVAHLTLLDERLSASVNEIVTLASATPAVWGAEPGPEFFYFCGEGGAWEMDSADSTVFAGILQPNGLVDLLQSARGLALPAATAVWLARLETVLHSPEGAAYLPFSVRHEHYAANADALQLVLDTVRARLPALEAVPLPPNSKAGTGVMLFLREGQTPAAAASSAPLPGFAGIRQLPSSSGAVRIGFYDGDVLLGSLCVKGGEPVIINVSSRTMSTLTYSSYTGFVRIAAVDTHRKKLARGGRVLSNAALVVDPHFSALLAVGFGTAEPTPLRALPAAALAEYPHRVDDNVIHSQAAQLIFSRLQVQGAEAEVQPLSTVTQANGKSRWSWLGCRVAVSPVEEGSLAPPSLLLLGDIDVALFKEIFVVGVKLPLDESIYSNSSTRRTRTLGFTPWHHQCCQTLRIINWYDECVYGPTEGTALVVVAMPAEEELALALGGGAVLGVGSLKAVVEEGAAIPLASSTEIGLLRRRFPDRLVQAAAPSASGGRSSSRLSSDSRAPQAAPKRAARAPSQLAGEQPHQLPLPAHLLEGGAVGEDGIAPVAKRGSKRSR